MDSEVFHEPCAVCAADCPEEDLTPVGIGGVEEMVCYRCAPGCEAVEG